MPVITPGSGEEGDNSRASQPEVSVSCTEATSQGVPSLLFYEYFGHITDLTLVTSMAEDAGPLWWVKVLDYFITKHPKVESSLDVFEGVSGA